MGTLIPIKTFGDFDAPQIDCVLYSTTAHNVGELLQEFASLVGINQPTCATFSENLKDDFIFFLTNIKDFKLIKQKNILLW